MRFALLSLCLITSTLRAQAPERAVFLVRQGAETLAVENTSRSGPRLEGRLLLRAPLVRIGQEATLTDSNTVRRVLRPACPRLTGQHAQPPAASTLIRAKPN